MSRVLGKLIHHVRLLSELDVIVAKDVVHELLLLSELSAHSSRLDDRLGSGKHRTSSSTVINSDRCALERIDKAGVDGRFQRAPSHRFMEEVASFKSLREHSDDASLASLRGLTHGAASTTVGAVRVSRDRDGVQASL